MARDHSCMESIRVETARRPGGRVRLVIEVPPEEVEAHRRRAAAAVARVAEVDGFRKGKAPLAMVERRFAATIDREALEEIVPHAVSHALEKTGLRPHWYGEITHPALARGAGLTIEAEVEVAPDLAPKGTDGLRVKRRRVVVLDADVDAAIADVRERNAEWEAVGTERAAADGDLVLVDFAGSIDGRPIPRARGESYPILLGSGASIPGFEEALRGTRAGETKSFTARFPDDHGDEALRGKTATFEATVRAVKEKRLPPADDDLARAAGAESLAALRASIAERIREAREAEAEAEVEEQILEALTAAHPLDDLPATLVDEETERQIGRFFRRLQSAGLPPSLWMKEKGLDEAGVRAEFAARARKGVHAFLVAAATARAEGVTVGDLEVSERLATVAAARNEDPRKFARRLAEEGKIRRIREEMAVEKILKRLRERAQVEEVEA